MTEKDDVKVAGNEVIENLASSIFNFKFLSTFKFIFNDQGKLGNAIVTQDFDNILTPNKYFSAGLAVAVAGILLRQLATGDTCNAWGYDRPLPYIVFAFVGVPFGLTQYFYLRYSVGKQMGRMVEVLAKLYQCYAFVIGSILGVFGFALVFYFIANIVREVGRAAPDHLASSIFGLLFALLAIVTLAAIPWIFLVAPPRIIATIYGLKAGQAWKALLSGLAAGFLGLFLGLYVYFSLGISC
jgi:hypothetical protein